MSDIIDLNPELLLEQSNNMLNIYSSFESLFNGILENLNRLNSSWSEVLSKNFTGKISSAQKSFMGSLSMLKISADSTRLVANSLLELDSEQAAKIGSNSSLGNIHGILSKAIKDAIPNMSDIQRSYTDVTGKIDDLYENAFTSSERAWLKELKDKLLKEYGLEDANTAYEITDAILKGDYITAYEKYGDNLTDEMFKAIAKKDNEMLKTLKLGRNIVKDGSAAITDYYLDPSMENLAKIPWSVTGQPVLDMVGKDISKYVSMIPGISEYYDANGGTDIGNMAQTALGDFYYNITGNDEMRDYVKNYYSNAGGAFEGVYQGVSDIGSFIKESGGIGQAFSRAIDASKDDFQNLKSNFSFIGQTLNDNGGFFSTIYKYCDIFDKSTSVKNED